MNQADREVLIQRKCNKLQEKTRVPSMEKVLKITVTSYFPDPLGKYSKEMNLILQ